LFILAPNEKESRSDKWRAQITLEDHRLSFTGETRQEAQDWLHKTRHQISRGLTRKGAITTYAEFLEDWLATKFIM